MRGDAHRLGDVRRAARLQVRARPTARPRRSPRRSTAGPGTSDGTPAALPEPLDRRSGHARRTVCDGRLRVCDGRLRAASLLTHTAPASNDRARHASADRGRRRPARGHVQQQPYVDAGDNHAVGRRAFPRAPRRSGRRSGPRAWSSFAAPGLDAAARPVRSVLPEADRPAGAGIRLCGPPGDVPAWCRPGAEARPSLGDAGGCDDRDVVDDAGARTWGRAPAAQGARARLPRPA